jgi:NAD(P)-dependent dehydrogenase (short-subunit alcohol dehydrogenase family)
MPGTLEGRVALVTGAGSGIGRASALAFAREGARVVVSDVSEERGAATVREVESGGGEALFVRADVSRAGEVAALVGRTLEEFGRLDCAHNNAGIEGAWSTTADYEEEVFDRVVSVNLKGVWLCMKYEIPPMVAAGGGAIVNTASVAGLVGAEFLSAYAASKHGVVGLTRTAALENARTGVRINAVCPSFVHTPMVERFTGGDPNAEKRLMRAAPVGRMGTAEEVADAVTWLCSDAASFVTGTAMPVDGGLTAR